MPELLTELEEAQQAAGAVFNVSTALAGCARVCMLLLQELRSSQRGDGVQHAVGAGSDACPPLQHAARHHLADFQM